MFKKRREKILRYCNKLGYSAVAAFRPQNVYYLTGFWGEGIAFCIDNLTTIIIPKLEARRAEKQAKSCEIISTDRGSSMALALFSKINGEKTCSDCDDYFAIKMLQDKLGKNSFDVNLEPFKLARLIKDEYEVNMIENGAKIVDNLYELCIEEIKEGVSERDLQSVLVFEALKLGANIVPYAFTVNPFIVASGPHSSFPHAEISNRKFKANDIIVVDITLGYKSYVADATRTFFLGNLDSKMRRLYDLVKNAQQAAIEALVSSSTTGEVDKACRQVITDFGYGTYFIHSTGHGVGLDIHEPPWIRQGEDEMLKGNMTVTVEPGVYLPGKYGMRVEDTLVINSRGSRAKNLNSFTKELIQLG